MPDIYFLKEYAELHEKIEKGEADFFEVKSKNGWITHSFIKREISIDGEFTGYYDLITPYGYGGPIIHSSENINSLKKEFVESFEKYCLSNKIVTEFVRFHPLINNEKDFRYLYDTEFTRKTVGTNLSDFETPFQEEFSKSCRKKINKQLRDGMTYEIIEAPNDASEFLEFYHSTMDRNRADEFYYFNKDYFNNIIKEMKENVVLVKALYEEKPIAMGFYLIYEDYIHIHLSGTLSEYLNYSPAYMLRYGIVKWGKENKYKMIHHGGGRTDSESDGLYKFKRQFGKNTEFDFYIGKKVWNEEIYEELTEGSGQGEKFFPAYRGIKANG